MLPAALLRRTTALVGSQGRALTRGFAADHGPPKVNFWQDPLKPGNWKEEQLVLAILGGWGVVIAGATRSGGKK